MAESMMQLRLRATREAGLSRDQVRGMDEDELRAAISKAGKNGSGSKRTAKRTVKKATGGGLPVEVWTRFMRTAHQGVPVAALQTSRGSGGLFSNLMPQFGDQQQPQAAQPRGSFQPPPMQDANPMDPYANTPQARAQRPAPVNANVRPEAAAGLDGWLVDRLFGRR